ncbi:MAG: hypothetical protein WA211_05830 [Candidatus Acidiferrales bacterium]
MRSQAVIGFCVFVIGIFAAYQLGGKISGGDMSTVEFAGFGFAAIWVGLTILKNWRLGTYMFLVWLIFEDLVRKYLGNNMAIYFGKDVLVGLVFVSLLTEVRRGRVKLFRPPFLLFLYFFLFLGALEIFNSNSPSILYGLMGFKLYFYYMPLMFVGYALIRDDEDLRKFLVFNVGLAGLVGVIGIIQAILGHSFLNPANLAPELKDLGELDRYTPLTNQLVSIPSSVFVSAGRYSLYLVLAFALAVGTAGYLFLYTTKNRKLVYLVLGILVAATLFCGSRGAVLYVFASSLILAAAFLWGAPWRWQQAHRMFKAMRRVFIVGALGLTAILLIFPEEAAPRVAFYMETLDPNSSAYEVGTRTWDYPMGGLISAIEQPHWLVGNGLGTASLGGQYVAKILGKPPIAVWVEEGYGQMILEMGFAAPFLWILWTAALLVYGWRVVRRLRQTRFFPIAFAILWYTFLLLYPFTYGGLAPYQNFLDNAYLWLIVGILFKLPQLYAANPSGAPAPAAVPAPPGWRHPHAFRV